MSPPEQHAISKHPSRILCLNKLFLAVGIVLLLNSSLEPRLGQNSQLSAIPGVIFSVLFFNWLKVS